MNESKFKLKPISKKEFERLSPRRSNYKLVIQEFLNSNHDVMEIQIEGTTTKPTTIYQSLKRHAKRKNYPFLVRRREGRIFLLKRHPINEEV